MKRITLVVAALTLACILLPTRAGNVANQFLATSSPDSLACATVSWEETRSIREFAS